MSIQRRGGVIASLTHSAPHSSSNLTWSVVVTKSMAEQFMQYQTWVGREAFKEFKSVSW